MNVSVENRGTETVLVVAGEVDADNCSVLGSALAEHRDVKQSVVIDLRAVTFIDSSGVSELLRLQKLQEADGGELRIENPSRTVHRVLEITDLLTVLGVT